MLAGGNLLSYAPVTPELVSDFHNETLVHAWTSGVVPIPLNAAALLWTVLFSNITFGMLPFVAAAVHIGLDKGCDTWYASYMNTPAQRLSMVLLYVCFWGFFGHVVQLFASNDCDICTGLIGKTWPWRTYEVIEKYFPSAFWMHAAPAAAIALLGPFQFTVKVRQWNNFCAHRWIGRAVLTASCIHQTSATYLTISCLFFNRHNYFPTSRTANTIYTLGFVPFNVYSWTATILGWKRARQNKIVSHGAWMYRLGSMWVITIVIFRWLQPVASELIGQEWGLALHIWFAFSLTIPVEIFIRKSGRFDWNGASKTAARQEQCPFFGIVGQGTANSASRPFLAAE